MTLAAEMVLDQFERWGIDALPSQDADLIAGVYELLAEETNVVQITQWLAEQVQTRGLGNVGQGKTGAVGNKDRGADTTAARGSPKAAAGGKR